MLGCRFTRAAGRLMYLPPTSRASAVNVAMSRPQSVSDAGGHECVGRLTGAYRQPFWGVDATGYW